MSVWTHVTGILRLDGIAGPPQLPRVTQLVSNVAWGKITGCPVHEPKV